MVALRCDDSHERMGWIREADIESTLCGPVTTEWALAILPLPCGRLTLFTEGANNVQCSQFSREHCGFVFNMGGVAEVNGQDISRHQFLFAHPGQDYTGKLEAGLRWGAYALTLTSLEQRMDTLKLHMPATAHSGSAIFAPPPEVAATLQNLLRQAAQATRTLGVLSSETSRHVLEEALLDAIVQALDNRVAPSRRTVALGRVFSRAVEFLRARDDAVRIPELCEAVGVGARTLAYAFGEYTGLSPAQFIRLRRLHFARRLLMFAEGCSVTDAAFRYGFFELGRFSAHYRGVFGENPNDTVRRRVALYGRR